MLIRDGRWSIAFFLKKIRYGYCKDMKILAIFCIDKEVMLTVLYI